MTWFKIDDGLWSHPKFLILSDSAQALWMRAGSYSCAHLTDGFIPDAAAKTILRGKPKAIAELVLVIPGFTSSLWEKVPGGYQFHDWAEYQEASDVVKRRREEARERMKNVRANKSRSSLNPDPTRPDPTTGQDFSTSVQSGNAREDDDIQHGGNSVHNSSGVSVARIQAALQAKTDREANEFQAAAVAEVVLDRSKRRSAITDPTRYVVKAITNDPFVWQKYLDTGEEPAA